MRTAFFALALPFFALSSSVVAAPLTAQEVRQLVEPHLTVCMEIPIGPYRFGTDKELEAQVNGLRDRGLVTLTTIGQGDSLTSGDSDLERLEEQRPFSRLVDVALAETVDRGALCAMSRHRLGVPLGAQTVTDVTKIEPVADGGSEAQVLADGTIDRRLSKYAVRFDPALTVKATFQALLAYDNVAKSWVVRRLVTQNVSEGAR